jgi:hypothetical protein
MHLTNGKHRARRVLLFALMMSSNSSAAIINIDFGLSISAPPPTYSAAGAAGTWNVISNLGTSPVNGIVDGGGNLTTLSVTSSASMFATTPAFQPIDGSDGDLLGDYIVSGGNSATLTFSGLPDGDYRILTYTVARQDEPDFATVMPLGNPLLALTNTGIWAGALQQGVTHSLHDISIAQGGFTLRITTSSDAFVNGVQIISIPDPSAAAPGLFAIFLGWVHGRRSAMSVACRSTNAPASRSEHLQ